MKKPLISIVIPRKMGQDSRVTLKSLKTQDFNDYEVIEVPDEWKGANYARNLGASRAKSNLILFCDNDIEWEDDGITSLYNALMFNPDKAYSYGAYVSYHEGYPEVIYGDIDFNPTILEDHNYISTMCLVRKKDFVEVGGFDERIERFQDWDLWLTMLKHNKTGVWCRSIIFQSESRLAMPDPVKYEELKQIVKDKYEK